VSWRRIGALNTRHDWIARTLGVTFVDPNSWIENWDFGNDSLHLNQSGARIFIAQMIEALFYKPEGLRFDSR
jgi:hypothetical protein